MPTPLTIRTPEACRAIRNCLNADASLNRIARSAGVYPSSVKAAIEAGREEGAPQHLREIAIAFDRQQYRRREAGRRAENACAILEAAVQNP